MNVNLKLTLAVAAAVSVSYAIPSRALNSAPPSFPTSPSASQASTSDKSDNGNPYSIITDRNIFRLNPVPDQPKPEEKPVELPKVNFNGTMKIGSVVRALFSIPAKDAKSQTAYFKLAPGEKQDVVELVSIHADQREVDVLIAGTQATLSSTNNASAGPKGAPPGPAPAPPPVAAVAPSGGPSAIVAGGNHGDSAYGNVQVAGGNGGVANNSYGNVQVGGGNRGGGTPSYGGNNSLNPSALASAMSGGGNGVSVGGGSQFATTLSAGASPSPSQLPTAPAHIATPEQQAASMIIQNALAGGNGPPMPPPIAQAASELQGGSK
jgi:hypothetical protein